MSKDIMYVELAKAKIQDRRNVTISECSKGGFTIAQQLEVAEGGRTTSVFLKGAFHVATVSGLVNLRDALNVAIEEYQNSITSSQDSSNVCAVDDCTAKAAGSHLDDAWED